MAKKKVANQKLISPGQQPGQQPSQQPGQHQKSNQVLPSKDQKPKRIGVTVRTSDMNDPAETYIVDSVDMLSLLNGQIPFIEIGTPKSRGVRFVTVTYGLY